ncbi:Stk1 family PASTA domain-containing Ser/Thr kinase [Candidatus Contubernalis alkaliaceticus]|uniref:Stk1 family PASTA domain-containing Ser/Thr kinase n=1 Tax=Candidatus Contubernalis alkaliaceticus TaxID=338645 RepID=UPI001F4C3D4D|nr:Stk1 family PASTA domain-containing Ser/Thr kinase [Candidatus Contubernalis alkalaceticus]UNC92782.1 Stk1 family PASTA domain-containing Ser/Thr kinase [Candidatus Contubernalis alkalaceticus]
MIDKVLANRYKIEEKIGDGGMAVVYRGYDKILNRSVTVKVLRAQFALDENFVRRFKREAQSAASLSHPNVVNIFDVGEEDGTYYIVMEYVDGKSLKELITENGKLPVNAAVKIAHQICEALVHAHKNKIIHRDIKPHNILLTRDGRVKVTDFGIAKAVTAATVTYDNNVVMGSVHYFAPEQAKGGIAGEKADLYSLGIVLYEMLTGEVPFSGETPISVALQHLQENIKSPKELNSEVPQTLEKIIFKAVQKDPDMRYESAEVMLEDLDLWINNGHVSPGRFDRPGVNKIQDQFVPVNNNNHSNGNHEQIIPSGEKEPKEKKWKKRWLAVGFVSFIVFVIVLSFLFSQLRGMLVVEEVNVPDVTNIPLAEAAGILEEAGLEYVVLEEIENDEVPEGNVISQFPEADKSVKKGREVELVVSKGPALLQVPLVEGLMESAAKILLQEADLVVEVDEEFSSTIPVGEVISQNPRAGSEANRGDIVTIVVSKGSEPFRMPNLVGRSLADALDWIELYKLTSGNIDEQYSSSVPEGRVIEQSPKAGDMVQPQESVALVISKGPDPTEIGFNITIDPSLWGVPQGEGVRVDIEDSKGVRTVFEGIFEGSKIEVEGWGSGTVTILMLTEDGYITLGVEQFPQ